MYRLLQALAALISLAALNLPNAAAQGVSGPTADPATAPRETTERAGAPEEPAAARRPMVVTPIMNIEPGQSERIGPAQTVGDVSMREGSLVLEGRVTHDILAIKSAVTLAPGAVVGGHLISVGGTVDNRAGSAASVIQVDSGAAGTAPRTMVAAMLAQQPIAASSVTPVPAAIAPRPRYGWFSGQTALLMFGLLVGLALMMVAPRATAQSAAAVPMSPARSLVVGAGGGLGLLIAQVLNAGMLASPVRLVWAPFGLALALGAAVLLACGWICGMRFVGDLIAGAFGRSPNGGSRYVRTAVGLAASFALNCALGIVHPSLVAAGLTLEFTIALIGLGGIVISGFGADPDWLTRRLQRKASWFSRNVG